MNAGHVCAIEPRVSGARAHASRRLPAAARGECQGANHASSAERTHTRSARCAPWELDQQAGVTDGTSYSAMPSGNFECHRPRRPDADSPPPRSRRCPWVHGGSSARRHRRRPGRAGAGPTPRCPRHSPGVRPPADGADAAAASVATHSATLHLIEPIVCFARTRCALGGRWAAGARAAGAVWSWGGSRGRHGPCRPGARGDEAPSPASHAPPRPAPHPGRCRQRGWRGGCGPRRCSRGTARGEPMAGP